MNTKCEPLPLVTMLNYASGLTKNTIVYLDLAIARSTEDKVKVFKTIFAHTSS